jgi:hypothetical protein
MIMIQTYYPRGHLAHFIGEAGGHLSRAQAKYYLVELVGFQRSIYISFLSFRLHLVYCHSRYP